MWYNYSNVYSFYKSSASSKMRFRCSKKGQFDVVSP